jgi:hypothetical protein
MEAERTFEIACHWFNGEWGSSTKISDSLNPSTGPHQTPNMRQGRKPRGG